MLEILIIKPSSLGDIVHALQVATSLKAQRGDLRISWIVRDVFAPLVRICEAVDEVFVFERKGGIRGFLRLMREVRKTQFDYVLDMQGLLRSGLMTLRTRAKKRIGRSDAREGSGLFYDEKVKLPPQGRHSHALDILLQFCPVLDAKPVLQGRVTFRAAEQFSLSFAEPISDLKPILMFPDSRREEKKWNGFVELAQRILRENRERQVIWAGNAYLHAPDTLPANRFLNLTGNTSLFSLPALVQRADWVISNDSGPMHLAAALGVKTLGIFGPTDPQRYGPYPLTSPTNLVLQAPVGDLKLLSARAVHEHLTSAHARLSA